MRAVTLLCILVLLTGCRAHKQTSQTSVTETDIKTGQTVKEESHKETHAADRLSFAADTASLIVEADSIVTKDGDKLYNPRLKFVANNIIGSGEATNDDMQTTKTERSDSISANVKTYDEENEDSSAVAVAEPCGKGWIWILAVAAVVAVIAIFGKKIKRLLYYCK